MWKLKPNTEYAFGLNADGYDPFVSDKADILYPVAIRFKTGKNYGTHSIGLRRLQLIDLVELLLLSHQNQDVAILNDKIGSRDECRFLRDDPFDSDDLYPVFVP
jgi:hypothetical protein